ncbi:4Fe-4S dicluster domain-containing protein [Bacilliculturomica massiliensis]|uniref:4Fe-4S dicluster domain-containing protein n=1 Tax=Bacilliculturomica massiliensis TaxID=1917867 RepID=UPI0010321A1E|nr:ferredoxin family protein [Bacilliculturomica massiliensis]
MNEKNRLTAAVVPCSAQPLLFDETLCAGCNRCVEVCQVDIMIPNPEKGRPPVVLYPGECYYCGSCVMECPVDRALRLQHPLMNRAKFVPARG